MKIQNSNQEPEKIRRAEHSRFNHAPKIVSSSRSFFKKISFIIIDYR